MRRLIITSILLLLSTMALAAHAEETLFQLNNEDLITQPSGEKFSTHTENFDIMCKLSPVDNMDSRFWVGTVDRLFIKTSSPIRVTEAYVNDFWLKEKIEEALGRSIVGREFYVLDTAVARCGPQICLDIQANVDVNEPADTRIELRGTQLNVVDIKANELMATGECEPNEVP